MSSTQPLLKIINIMTRFVPHPKQEYQHFTICSFFTEKIQTDLFLVQQTPLIKVFAVMNET